MPATFTGTEPDAPPVTDALRVAGFELAPADKVTRTVLDTFDGRLHAAGLRLEHHGAPVAALVLIGGDDTPPAHLPMGTVPRVGHDLPAGPFRNRVVAHSAERALLASVTLTASRTLASRRDRRGKETVAVAVYEQARAQVAGTPGAGPDAARLPAVVVEVTGSVGHPDPFERTKELLASLGLDAVDDDVVTLAAAAVGVDLAGREASPTVPMRPDEPAFVAYRRVLANLAATVEANRAGTIDDLDLEFLHELRVAVRRTRSVLSQGRDVLPADIRDHYREVFGWLGTETGPARDLDVYVFGWQDYIAPVSERARLALGPVRHQLDGRRRKAHKALAPVLRSARYAQAMGEWQAWLRDPAAAGPKGDEPVGAIVAKRIAKAQRKVIGDGRAIHADSPAERLHDLRKDAKKLRYLLECFGGLLDPKPRKAFVKRLKALQDNLGAHQDADVHIEQLRELAVELNAAGACDAAALLAMGQLTVHLEARRVTERDRFAAQFAGYDTDATAGTLAELLRPLRGAS